MGRRPWSPICSATVERPQPERERSWFNRREIREESGPLPRHVKAQGLDKTDPNSEFRNELRFDSEIGYRDVRRRHVFSAKPGEHHAARSHQGPAGGTIRAAVCAVGRGAQTAWRGAPRSPIRKAIPAASASPMRRPATNRSLSTFDQIHTVPEQLRTRTLAVRGFDRDGMMTGSELVDGANLEDAIERQFAHPCGLCARPFRRGRLLRRAGRAGVGFSPISAAEILAAGDGASQHICARHVA